MSPLPNETDVIVVGGGGAGLTAAIFAARAGARVVLLEKDVQLGGSTRLCVGTYTASGTDLQRRLGIDDSAQAHFEDMPKFGTEALAVRDNIALRRLLVDNATETLRWLVSLGITFHGPAPEPPHRVPRMHTILPNSDAFIYFLEREAQRVGVHIALNARVERLRVHQGRVSGVDLRLSTGMLTLTASRAVVLATGDFSASSAWKGRYEPAMADIEGIAAGSTGDGHRMAEELGAQVRFGDVFYGPNLRFAPPPAKGLLQRLPPHRWLTAAMARALDWLPAWMLRPFILSFLTTYLSPEPGLFRAGAILVNRLGERFTDELDRPNYDFGQQPDKLAYIVFDHSVALRFSQWPHFISTAPGVAYAYFEDYRRSRPDIFHQGDTLQALSQAIDVPSQTLVATVARHNVECAAEQSRPPIGQGPYFALGPVKSWVLLTEGSVTINSRHQVVRADGSAIPGLYAVGAVGQGGLLLLGHGHHLAWVFTSGRLGGHAAAAGT